MIFTGKKDLSKVGLKSLQGRSLKLNLLITLINGNYRLNKAIFFMIICVWVSMSRFSLFYDCTCTCNLIVIYSNKCASVLKLRSFHVTLFSSKNNLRYTFLSSNLYKYNEIPWHVILIVIHLYIFMYFFLIKRTLPLLVVLKRKLFIYSGYRITESTS